MYLSIICFNISFPHTKIIFYNTDRYCHSTIFILKTYKFYIKITTNILQHLLVVVNFCHFFSLIYSFFITFYQISCFCTYITTRFIFLSFYCLFIICLKTFPSYPKRPPMPPIHNLTKQTYHTLLCFLLFYHIL